MHIYVETEVDEGGYPPFEAEELHAEFLSPGRARIVSIPNFVYGLAVGDVVQFETLGGPNPEAWAVAVLEQSSNWTARVMAFAEAEADAIVGEFLALGCDCVSFRYSVIAIDVPETADQDTVLKLLEDGRDSKRWDFDLGVDPRA